MNNQTADIINRVLPILLLISLGYGIRRMNFLGEEIVQGLTKLVVNIALPSVLFISFLYVDFQPAFLIIFLFVFGLNVGLYLLGKVLRPRVAPDHEYYPYLMTGFEYGMLGISLFGSAYGLANIGILAVVDLGHEIFIWFVFLPLLLIKRDGIQRTSDLLASFLKSPVIIAILAGILLNVVGVAGSLAAWPISGGILSSLEFLAAMTIPLILIIVGYGIKFDKQGIGSAARVVIIRLSILIPLVLLLNYFVVGRLLGLGQAYQIALFTLFILPPPFIIPLFMKKDLAGERRYVNNVLTLYTIASIIVFAIYFILNPTL
jgi:malate permease and related proteins